MQETSRRLTGYLGGLIGLLALGWAAIRISDNALENAPEDRVSLFDALLLDEWTVPFGDWIDQSVIWIDQNLEPFLNAFKWPFEFLLKVVVTDGVLFLPGLVDVPWIYVAITFVVLGALARNIGVGLFAGLALTFCGLLGQEYWLATAKTIGFIVVAVILCALIGIPVGVLCGRVDSFWSVVRPILDAMQVVHSFVYMLPFIFFFGIGEESATMVTMVFALPPLIRLTNLGIRQVPEDVVEAARAYGAPEMKVLTDVQLPLARPAIMTGLNQTLLLSISMLGIAAIMGAGGLGQLLFRAINNQDVALSASAGLAFFLVAVVLDRISQREDADQGGLFSRIRRAWANRATPENLLPDADQSRVAPKEVDEGRLSPHSARERLGLPVAAVGGAVAILSVFLTWGSDAGLVSGHARFADLDLAGQSFSGLDGSGGSWFGWILLGLGLYATLASATRYFRPTHTARWFSADGALIAGFGMLGASLSYLLMAENPGVVAYSHGVGVYLAVIGSLLLVGGAWWATTDAPYSARIPLSAKVGWSRVAGAGVALLVVVAGLFSGWVFDQRVDEEGGIPPEIQAEIDLLIEQAETNPSLASANANRVQSLLNQARNQALNVYDGFNENSFQLGPLTLILALAAVAATIPAVGIIGSGDHMRWKWSAIVAGLGIALVVLSSAVIASTTRVREPEFTTGIGVFLILVGGYFFLSTARKMLGVFERTKVYASVAAEAAPAAAPVREPEEVAG